MTGFREYLVSPLLVHNQVTDLHAQQFRQLSDKQLGKLPEKLQLTRSDRRYQRMIDSGATGALVGSVASWGLSGSSRLQRGVDRSDLPGLAGRRAAIRGGVTGAVACSLLQLTANSLRMLKSDYLDPHEPDPPRQGQSDHSVGHSIDEAQLPPQSSSSVQSQDGSNPTKGQVEGQSRLQSWLSSLWQYAPMKRVSDPDYLKTLNARLATVDAKLMKLEDEELKLYQKVQEAEHRKREGKDRMV